jgi:hypothetical protein
MSTFFEEWKACQCTVWDGLVSTVLQDLGKQVVLGKSRGTGP